MPKYPRSSITRIFENRPQFSEARDQFSRRRVAARNFPVPSLRRRRRSVRPGRSFCALAELAVAFLEEACNVASDIEQHPQKLIRLAPVRAPRENSIFATPFSLLREINLIHQPILMGYAGDIGGYPY